MQTRTNLIDAILLPAMNVCLTDDEKTAVLRQKANPIDPLMILIFGKDPLPSA